MIAPILKQAINPAYEEAVKVLQKIRELMGRLDRLPTLKITLGATRRIPTETQFHQAA